MRETECVSKNVGVLVLNAATFPKFAFFFSFLSHCANLLVPSGYLRALVAAGASGGLEVLC